MKKRNLNIVKSIELLRSKNNKNWMDLLRLAITYAPKKSKIIIKRINLYDRKISNLLKNLEK